ncbi:MAG: uroporphyrinogen decarboxylase (URO-D), partial [Clostridiales bacterium]|nr:uroporphyrinogen decarboxylase (URO-D) [Clostridiales bacterium]
MNAKQNFLETIKPGGKPDRIVKQFEGTKFMPLDPVNSYARSKRYQGMPPNKDAWGTVMVWPEDIVAPMPLVNEETKV